MKERGRGSTRRGRPSALPDGEYEPALWPETAGRHGLVVQFHGDDNRRCRFDCAELPLEGWRLPLAEALAWRIGAAGGLGTLSSARDCWRAVGRWTRFLETLPAGPAVPGELTRAHVEAFQQNPESKIAARDLPKLRLLFEAASMRPQLAPEAWDAFGVPGEGRHRPGGTPGYSDGELASLLAALRSDCVAIRRRLQAGEDLLLRYRTDPAQLGSAELDLAASLAAMADTGVVPRPRLATRELWRHRLALASHLFLTPEDLAPLMMLMAALAHRNGETVKELPVKHRLLEDRAVELTIVKRRRGDRRWYEQVTWEIGPAGRELHYPGGMYLLLLKLTARSRAWCHSPLALAVWRNHVSPEMSGTAEHFAPYQEDLRGPDLNLSGWARDRGVLADPMPQLERVALDLSFNRIKTSMDVRRTKQLGGHLPSAARSNTVQVLFRHYLSGDPVITAWASEVMAEALVDAEQSAIAAHRRALEAAGGSIQVVPGPVSAEALAEAGLPQETAELAAVGQLDTGWAGCTDHDHHPATGEECQVTFLDCFHCGNCLVTRAHLPRLLELLDALNIRRTAMSQDDWWARYGPVWAAIRHDILTKFTPAERALAEQEKTTDAILDLVENPWDIP
nr:hypothetical protein KPHV_86620 [Kitasatospora purpeofusca]